MKEMIKKTIAGVLLITGLVAPFATPKASANSNNLNQEKNIYKKASMASPCQDSLLTPIGNQKMADGVLLQIKSIADGVIITGFSTMVSGTGLTKVYYKEGSYTSGEFSSAGWTLVDSTTITVASTRPVKVADNLKITVAAGGSASFYITGTGQAKMSFAEAAEESAPLAGNGLMQVLSGRAVSHPFKATATRAGFSGVVDYCSTFPTSMGDDVINDNIHVGPNPFKTSTNIVISGENKFTDVALVMYDMLGKEVQKVNYTIDITKTKNTLKLERGNLPAGMYFYKLQNNDDNVISSGKLMIE